MIDNGTHCIFKTEEDGKRFVIWTCMRQLLQLVDRWNFALVIPFALRNQRHLISYSSWKSLVLWKKVQRTVLVDFRTSCFSSPSTVKIDRRQQRCSTFKHLSGKLCNCNIQLVRFFICTKPLFMLLCRLENFLLIRK